MRIMDQVCKLKQNEVFLLNLYFMIIISICKQQKVEAIRDLLTEENFGHLVMEEKAFKILIGKKNQINTHHSVLI